MVFWRFFYLSGGAHHFFRGKIIPVNALKAMVFIRPEAKNSLKTAENAEKSNFFRKIF